MAVQFVNGGVDDADRLRSFFGAMYSPAYVLSRSDAFLQWQFAAVPSTRRAGLDVKLALVDGAIAGCLGYIPVELTVGGAPVTAAWAANWMVDDQYRRLGLGPLLMRELCRDFDVTLALGGNRDAHALLPRMGWTDFGDLQRYVGVLDPIAAAQLGDVSGLPVVLASSDGASRATGVAEDAGALWDRVNAGVAGTRRTAEYLHWRYRSHPLFEYRFFERRSHGTLTGLGVYRLETARDVDVTVGRIVELIAAPGDALAVLGAMAADAAAEGAALVDVFCASARFHAELDHAHFLRDANGRFPMLFQPIDRSRTGVLFMADLRKCSAAAAATEWYVTTSDGDQDRPN